jgi:integrase
MAAKQAKLTKRVVEKMEPETIIRDTELRGFFARRQFGRDVTYSISYRTKHGVQRTAKIGVHGDADWTADSARAKAKEIRAAVAAGGDPAGDKYADRKAETMEQLCARYEAATKAGRVLTRSGSAKRASTLKYDQGAIQRHIVPLLGKLKVAAVTRKDVEGFRNSVTEGETAGRFKTGVPGLARVSGGGGTAARALGLLGGIFTYAIEQGLRTDNPVKNVKRRKDETRDRRVSPEEFARLGEALRNPPEGLWPGAVSATRFLALSGWRRGEMQALRWSEVDLQRRVASLPSTKTGRSVRPLPRPVVDLLADLPRLGELVFPSGRGVDAQMAGYSKIWTKIAAHASLPADVTPHIFRHSFASEAGDQNYSELITAPILGHKKGGMTASYTHAHLAILLAAADAVGGRINEMMGFPAPTGAVVKVDFQNVA